MDSVAGIYETEETAGLTSVYDEQPFANTVHTHTLAGAMPAPGVSPRVCERAARRARARPVCVSLCGSSDHCVVGFEDGAVAAWRVDGDLPAREDVTAASPSPRVAPRSRVVRELSGSDGDGCPVDALALLPACIAHPSGAVAVAHGGVDADVVGVGGYVPRPARVAVLDLDTGRAIRLLTLPMSWPNGGVCPVASLVPAGAEGASSPSPRRASPRRRGRAGSPRIASRASCVERRVCPVPVAVIPVGPSTPPRSDGPLRESTRSPLRGNPARSCSAPILEPFAGRRRVRGGRGRRRARGAGWAWGCAAAWTCVPKAAGVAPGRATDGWLRRAALGGAALERCVARRPARASLVPAPLAGASSRPPGTTCAGRWSGGALGADGVEAVRRPGRARRRKRRAFGGRRRRRRRRGRTSTRARGRLSRPRRASDDDTCPTAWRFPARAGTLRQYRYDLRTSLRERGAAEERRRRQVLRRAVLPLVPRRGLPKFPKGRPAREDVDLFEATVPGLCQWRARRTGKASAPWREISLDFARSPSCFSRGGRATAKRPRRPPETLPRGARRAPRRRSGTRAPASTTVFCVRLSARRLRAESRTRTRRPWRTANRFSARGFERGVFADGRVRRRPPPPSTSPPTSCAAWRPRTW